MRKYDRPALFAVRPADPIFANRIKTCITTTIPSSNPHTRQDVYAAYNTWCRETNSAAMSTRWFWSRLRKLVTIRELRHGSTRCVTLEIER